jgi:hypothetical protein
MTAAIRRRISEGQFKARWKAWRKKHKSKHKYAPGELRRKRQQAAYARAALARQRAARKAAAAAGEVA